MHKRILFVFVALVSLVCLSCFSVGAVGENADEDVPYIELMDYTMSPIDETMPGAFYVMGDYGFVGDFAAVLGEITAYGYEITYSYVGNRPTVTGASFGNFSDNDFKSRFIVDANIGKIRGSFWGSVGSNFGISFSSSGCYVTIHSVRVFTVPDYQVQLNAEIRGNGVTQPFVPGTMASVSTVGSASIRIDDWRNYDVVSLSATLGGYGITSVSARLIDSIEGFERVIPFDMNYINLSTDSVEHESVLLTMSCDLRVVDPGTTPDSLLVIDITTAVPAGKFGSVQLSEVYGSVLISAPDKYLPWIKLQYLILMEIQSNTYLAGTYSESIYNFFRDFYPSVYPSLLASIDSIVSSLDVLDDRFADFFKFDPLNRFDPEKTNPLWSFFGEFFLENIGLLQGLNNGTPVDSSVSQGMTSAGDQLADLGQQMAAGTPQVSTDFQLSIPEIPDDGSGVLATTMFSFFWGQDYIMKMLLTVVALATLSYVFFGKKG